MWFRMPVQVRHLLVIDCLGERVFQDGIGGEKGQMILRPEHVILTSIHTIH